MMGRTKMQKANPELTELAVKMSAKMKDDSRELREVWARFADNLFVLSPDAKLTAKQNLRDAIFWLEFAINYLDGGK